MIIIIATSIIISVTIMKSFIKKYTLSSSNSCSLEYFFFGYFEEKSLFLWNSLGLP